MTKISYALLVHKNPKQVVRLIKSLYSPSDYFNVVVFAQTADKDLWISELEGFEGPNFSINFREANAWGAFSVVEATLDAMKTFRNFHYDYFINLTGQCYPIKPIKKIKEHLMGKNLAYLEYFRVPQDSPSGWGKKGGLDRFQYSYYKNIFSVAYGSIIAKLRSKKYDVRRFIKIPKIKKQLPYNLEPYGGSAYFCLPKQHVDYILEYLSNHPNYPKYLHRSFAPDEIFFQTIIMNSPLREFVNNDNLRYIDWEKKGVPLPAILTIQDKEPLLTSHKLFARKFDPYIDEEILDLIDQSRQEAATTK